MAVPYRQVGKMTRNLSASGQLRRQDGYSYSLRRLTLRAAFATHCSSAARTCAVALLWARDCRSTNLYPLPPGAANSTPSHHPLVAAFFMLSLLAVNKIPECTNFTGRHGG